MRLEIIIVALIPLFMSVILGYIPFWTLIPIGLIAISLYISGYRNFENSIVTIIIIIGIFFIVMTFPIIFSQFQISLQSQTTTTTNNNGNVITEITAVPLFGNNATSFTEPVSTIFSILLPVMIVVTIMFGFIRMLGFEGWHDEDNNIRYRIGEYQGYTAYKSKDEATAFESEIMEMHNKLSENA